MVVFVYFGLGSVVVILFGFCVLAEWLVVTLYYKLVVLIRSEKCILNCWCRCLLEGVFVGLFENLGFLWLLGGVSEPLKVVVVHCWSLDLLMFL